MIAPRWHNSCHAVTEDQVVHFVSAQGEFSLLSQDIIVSSKLQISDGYGKKTTFFFFAHSLNQLQHCFFFRFRCVALFPF